MLFISISKNSAEVKDFYLVYTAGGRGTKLFFRYIQLTCYHVIQAQLNISPSIPILSKEQEQSQIHIAGVEVHVDSQPTVQSSTEGQQLHHLVQRCN